MQLEGSYEWEKKITVIAPNGCHENFYDAALLEKCLRHDERFSIVKSYKEADVIVVLGCAHTQDSQDESRALIEYLRQTKGDKAEILIPGCISKICPEYKLNTGENVDNYGIMASRFRDIDCSVSVSSLYPYKDAAVCTFLHDRKASLFAERIGSGHDNLLQTIALPVKKLLFDGVKYWKDYFEAKINLVNPETYCIKVSTGCIGRCSYCVIKKSRGKIQSKGVDRITAEFQEGLNSGFQQFALIGTDLADYGKDLEIDLIDLLERLTSLPGTFFIKLRNVNPRWVIAQGGNFLKLLNRGNIRYMLSPIQSGSDRILELMNRGYKKDDFINVIKKIRTAHPAMLIQSQVIAGFPTESEEDFRQTRELLDQNLFQYVDVFRYSDLEGTVSRTIYPKVPKPIIMARYRKLLFKCLLNHPLQKMQIIYGLNYV